MRTGDGNESDKAVFGQILSNQDLRRYAIYSVLSTWNYPYYN
jgi:hypothetical protein